MTVFVFLAVLAGAALHAGWNAIVKGGQDKLLSTALVIAAAAIVSVLLLPFLPAPASASWPWIAASTVFQLAYFGLVAQAYKLADMSQTYPLMRGSAPLLVALCGVAFMGEALSATGWLGILALCGGILVMLSPRALAGGGPGVAMALLNAVVIAIYTLIDGVGVRLSGAPAAYTLWLYVLTALPLLAFTCARRGLGPSLRYMARHWGRGLIGGIGTLASYGIALWAMTRAPVAVVAALRESSILFGVVISVLILRERVGPARLLGALVIALSAMVLRLA